MADKGTPLCCTIEPFLLNMNPTTSPTLQGSTDPASNHISAQSCSTNDNVQDMHAFSSNNIPRDVDGIILRSYNLQPPKHHRSTSPASRGTLQ